MHRVATNPFGGKCYRRGTERRRKAQEGGSGFDEQRTALFVAEGILRCRLSPETFITARRLLGITNVFDENDVDVPAVMFPRDPPRRFAESGIDMDKEAIGGSSPGCTAEPQDPLHLSAPLRSNSASPIKPRALQRGLLKGLHWAVKKKGSKSMGTYSTH